MLQAMLRIKLLLAVKIFAAGLEIGGRRFRRMLHLQF